MSSSNYPRPPQSSEPPSTVPIDRCIETLEAAELAWLQGLDQEAEALLLSARHGAMVAGELPMVARVEVAMAHFSIAIDEDERAQSHLLAAVNLPSKDREWQARAWLAHSIIQRRRGLSLPTERILPDVEALMEKDSWRPVAALVLAEFAAWACSRSDAVAALRHARNALEGAEATSYPCARAHVEIAEALLIDNQHEDASKHYLEAIDVLRTLGFVREEGRLLAKYALRVSANALPGTDEAPAAWLGRSKIVIGTSATWRDIASSRGGFRTHGRRLQDRAVSGSVAARIDELEEMTLRMRSVVSDWVDTADLSLAQAVRDGASENPHIFIHLQEARANLFQLLEVATEQSRRVGHAAAQVVEVIETTVVERDRMRLLLNILAQVDEMSELATLGSNAAKLAARLLQADQVVIARRSKDGVLEALGAFGVSDGTEDRVDWRVPVRAHMKGPVFRWTSEPPPARSDEKPKGPVLIAALRGNEIEGALYADKLHRSGRFNEQDHQLAQLFADYFGLAYSRLVALDAKHRAFEQLAITIDTIRDGVLAIDDGDVVQSANAATLRMLRSEAKEVIGRSISELETFSPLWEMLAGARRVDGALVRLKHGSFIVTARPVRSQGGSRGVVATLVELDRAQRIAHRVTARPRYEFSDILGSSEPLLRAVHLARQAANVEGSVLITGESGTGKEVFAQAIHTGGKRLAEPFVGVNVAAVPRELLEAELFGYERGAFTGARSEGNAGKFELAGEGTIMLDEIGDMPIDMQAKLLRVLQERVVVRLGGSAERPIRARIVTTTHRDLDSMVQAGGFRHDLLYRLKVLHVHLPPLRDRGGDMLLLARAFLDQFAKFQRKEVMSMSRRVEAELQRYSWPGNIRELANVIEREVSMLAPDETLLSVMQSVLQEPGGLAAQDSTEPEGSEEMVILPLKEVERRAYLRALEVCEGNVQRAAEALGVSKVTFYSKLRSWDLHPRDRGKRG